MGDWQIAGDNICAAAASGSSSLLHRLQRRGQLRLNQCLGSCGLTPLHLAVAGGHVATVRWLLAQNADIHSQDSFLGFSPLHLAARRADVLLMAVLISSGADLYARDYDGRLPLEVFPIQKGSEVPDVAEVGIRDECKLYTWGSGYNLTLGHGSNDDKVFPTHVASLAGVSVVETAEFHAAAICSSLRQLYTWGFGDSGRLGHGDMLSRPLPQMLHSGVRQVAASGSHSAFLTLEGVLFTFGRGDRGQLGLGPNLLVADRPHRVKGPLGAVFVVAVALGRMHSIVLSHAGQVFSWGAGDKGQLGCGLWDDRDVPHLVPFFRSLPVGLVAAAEEHSLVITRDNQVFMWGTGQFRPRKITLLQYFKHPDRKKAVRQPAYQIATGGVHCVSLSSSNLLFCWKACANPALPQSFAFSYGNVKQFSVSVDRLGVVSEIGDLFIYRWKSASNLPSLANRVSLENVQYVSLSTSMTAALVAAPKSVVSLSAQNVTVSVERDILQFFMSSKHQAAHDFVVILNENTSLPCHRLILSRCSYFSQLFERDPSIQRISLALPYSVFCPIIHLLYGEELRTTVSQTGCSLNELLQAARWLGLHQLEVAIQNKMGRKRRSVVPLLPLADYLWKLLSTARFSDVTLRAGSPPHECSYSAHWVVLIARCSYFDAMFRSGMRECAPGSEVLLPFVNHSVMWPLLEWLYRGRLFDRCKGENSIRLSLLAELLLVADQLGAMSLRQDCVSAISERLDLDNLCQLLELSNQFAIDELYDLCVDFLLHNLRAVLLSQALEDIFLSSDDNETAFRIRKSIMAQVGLSVTDSAENFSRSLGYSLTIPHPMTRERSHSSEDSDHLIRSQPLSQQPIECVDDKQYQALSSSVGCPQYQLTFDEASLRKRTSVGNPYGIPKKEDCSTFLENLQDFSCSHKFTQEVGDEDQNESFGNSRVKPSSNLISSKSSNACGSPRVWKEVANSPQCSWEDIVRKELELGQSKQPPEKQSKFRYVRFMSPTRSSGSPDILSVSPSESIQPWKTKTSSEFPSLDAPFEEDKQQQAQLQPGNFLDIVKEEQTASNLREMYAQCGLVIDEDELAKVVGALI